MNHTMKLWERVLGYKLRYETKKLENLFGFMMTYHGIYLLRHLMKKII